MEIPTRRRRLREHAPALVDEYGSPLYVFFESDLRENYRTLRRALDTYYPDSTVHFATKANYNLGVLSVLRDAGCHAEAYARCELSAIQAAGFDADDVLLTGMNRRQADIERALGLGVERLLVDNATELERVAAAARATDTDPGVLVRANPAMEVPTHPEVATATRETKFGLDVENGRAMAVARKAADIDRVSIAGVQLHLGSQIRDPEPYAVAADALCSFAADVRDELGIEVAILDMGGGFPVPYDEAVPETVTIVETLATAIHEACEEYGLARPHLFLEPGRRLVGNAGTLLGTVGVVKETPYANFAVLDAGTNAVSSYWPYPIYALPDRDGERAYHVAGPLCYSGDVIGEDVSLPPLERGDLVAVDRIGAYSLGSASHTNAEPKPPVLLVREDGTPDLVREGETCEDVLGNDRIPDDLS
ncbi:diaminopimelate decarboxylase [Halococcus agarilyticus]|uniref:diaminopimelate decarboxylase n=1 Tax=Halococcus agarilyticus TaxID=1232219 RepID=UPI000677F75F|nr:diaminopimelate decarboxylase [Halococcus agarilyticus]